jgi:hypothetical protein
VAHSDESPEAVVIPAEWKRKAVTGSDQRPEAVVHTPIADLVVAWRIITAVASRVDMVVVLERSTSQVIKQAPMMSVHVKVCSVALVSKNSDNSFPTPQTQWGHFVEERPMPWLKKMMFAVSMKLIVDETDNAPKTVFKHSGAD